MSTAPSPHNTGTEKAAATPDVLQQTSLENFLEWTLKVLGVAAACIFGVWAPLSYKATLDGNSGSDAAQSQAQSQASAAASQQSMVLSQQSMVLDGMNSRIGAIGQLWLFNFCSTQSVRPHVL
jgi:hypothetical protein